MKFVIDIPDSEKERVIALAMGIEGKMVYSGFVVNLEEKILLGMAQSLSNDGVAIPLDPEKYKDLESLKGADRKNEFITIRCASRSKRVAGSCLQCEGTGQINGERCSACNGSGR